MNKIILKAENISKSYNDGDNYLEIIKCLNFELSAGEMTAILGASGSGKSTLLHILAGLDQPTSGIIKFSNKVISKLSENQLAKNRNKNIGFIYQFHHLLAEFTAEENVAMPLLIAGEYFNDSLKKAAALLSEVGLTDRANSKPSQLSGGERQRVAIARAMINQPKCIFADEPTGNLDENNRDNVLQLLLDLNKKYNTSMVLVTHDDNIAKQLDKTYYLNHGKLELKR